MTVKRIGEMRALWLLMKHDSRWLWVGLIPCCLCTAILPRSTPLVPGIADIALAQCLGCCIVCVERFMRLADSRVLLTLPLSRRERERFRWINVMLHPVLIAATVYAVAALRVVGFGASPIVFLPATGQCLRLTALAGACLCVVRFGHVVMADREGRRGWAHAFGAVAALASLPVFAGGLLWVHLPSPLRGATAILGFCCLVFSHAGAPLAGKRSLRQPRMSIREKKVSRIFPSREGGLRYPCAIQAFVGSAAALAFVGAVAGFPMTAPEELATYVFIAFFTLGLVATRAQLPLRVYRTLPISSMALTGRFAAMHGAMCSGFAVVLLVVRALVPSLDTGDVLHLLPLFFGVALLLDATLLGLPPFVCGALLTIALLFMVVFPVLNDLPPRLKEYFPLVHLPWSAFALIGTAFALLGSLGIYLAITRSSRPYRKPVVME